MVANVSPLELLLDQQNPRFVILANREQANIRNYLVTYEDVCQLASDINDYGRILPGERIVALQENGHYVVVEGNRRTCALQLLLSPTLIPNGFSHRIPKASSILRENCSTIEIDVLPDRESALELMTRRHIEGVRQWKPLAKKQFFAANYRDGQGQTVKTLSKITGVKESEIRADIRDYKFFFDTYRKYCDLHDDFNKEIVILKTDPFWRIFKVKFEYPSGNKTSPNVFLKISYDDKMNTVSAIDSELFERITQLVFEQAIVEEKINTRNVLTDVNGIIPLLQAVLDSNNNVSNNTMPCVNESEKQEQEQTEGECAGSKSDNTQQKEHGDKDSSKTGGSQGSPQTDDSQTGDSQTGGPRPGGPAPKSFFETISWRGKLDPAVQNHQGLLYAINELYHLSNQKFGQKKAYQLFPIATGMILRTAYEQALRLRLIQVNLWGKYCSTRKKGALPTLKTMEDFINKDENKLIVLDTQRMVLIYDRVIAATHRDFLNANIHLAGNINVTSDSLEAIAAGGMFALIQGIINMI